MQKSSWFKEDDVEKNRLWGFDYCFCHNDCKNYECGRNNACDIFMATESECWQFGRQFLRCRIEVE